MDNRSGNGQIKRQRSFVTQQLKNHWLCRHSWQLWTKIKWRDATRKGFIDCGATSVFMTPRLLKRSGYQAAHIITLAMTGGVMQHAKDSRKTRITVQCVDYLAPADRSDVLVVPMRAYDSVLGLPWFPKQNPHIDWAQLTPCDHRVRVERRNDTNDYGSIIEGLGSRE